MFGFLLLLSIVSIVVLIDLTPIFLDWLGRIHIGRHRNIINWRRLITDVGLKWLNRTPKIKMTDNTRFVLLDILRGNYSKAAIQYWQKGAMLLGLSEQNKVEKCSRIDTEIAKFLDNTFDNNGQWKERPENVDAALLAYAVMKQEVVDPNHFRPAFDSIWELIKEHLGEDGTVRYRNSMKNYRYVDTIGFICPFLTMYGLKYNEPYCIEVAVRQILKYEQYGFHKDAHIPCHAYQLDSGLPQGQYGWGRGLGWYAIGLIDTWRELSQDHKYYQVLEESVKKFAKSVIYFQQPSGGWNWVVSQQESRTDSSATATLTWFLIGASVIDDLRFECLESEKKALEYLMKVTRRNGVIDFSQGDTKGIGVYSMLFNKLPFTQGFCIRSISHYKTSE